MGKGFNSLNQPQVAAEAIKDDQVNVSPAGRFADDINDSREERVKKILRRNAFVIAAIASAIIVVIIAVNTSHSRSVVLDKQTADILSLEQSIETNISQKDADYDIVIREATGGIDAEHRADDEESASRLFRDALTWDGMPEYMSKRDQVMRVYGLDEGSSFMTTFMPGELQGVSRKAPNGKIYYSNDADLNSKFESMDTTITRINGDVYSYWALITMRVQSDSGQTSTPMYATATFDVVDGKVVNLLATTNPMGVAKTA